MICEKHGYDLRYIRECPGCVREERDRYRKALKEILRYNQGDDGSGYIDHVATEALECK